MTTLLCDTHCDGHSPRVRHGDRIVMGQEREAKPDRRGISIPGFDVTGFIARGGMSRVYRATDARTGHEVALKVVPMGRDGEDTSRNQSMRRLASEGELLSALSHPNLMPVHALGEAEGWFYVAMSYAAGGDLMQKINRRPHVSEALRIAALVAQALDYAHGQGLVHRDVKPGNVLFMADGTPVLSDFGLAKPLGMQTGITRVGMVLGSPEYMSPEQAMGQPLDGRIDIYSLGAVLFSMLTGTPPYRGNSQIKTIRMHLDKPVPVLPRPHQWLQPLIDHSMAKDADNRFRSASAMAQSLIKAHDAWQAANRRNQEPCAKQPARR